MIEKLVILARGLGTRMRKQSGEASVAGEQAAAADSGVKALIPFDRPFLDYVLGNAAEAGYREICLVIGPDHDALRRYYGEQVEAKRLSFHFAVQEEPRGTADAVAAAEDFADGDHVVVLNSDNLYPAGALAALGELSGAGVALFEQEAMLAGSNVPADRLLKFAIGRSDSEGNLEEIIEKPDKAVFDALPAPHWVSMNCWRFGPSIFEACRNIEPSPRGELELPDAVTYAMRELGERFEVVQCREPVLDLSCRDDIGPVGERLKALRVEL